MITRGDVSLDVEDHRGPDDWPLISDVTSDMLMYSVHLPVDPKVSILLVGLGKDISCYLISGPNSILCPNLLCVLIH